MTTPAERNGVAAPLWRLRILSGLHAGAEAILADNEETTIGGNDECDLVLQDDGLGDRHIHLSISDAGVRLKVLELEQPVFVDGLKVEDAADLKPYQVVAFGLSSFALGPAGQEWPNIDIPGIRETESETGGEQPRPESRAPSPVNGSDPALDPRQPCQKRRRRPDSDSGNDFECIPPNWPGWRCSVRFSPSGC